ncbi:MAG: hypothetical protein M3O09_15250 [Acidobacteriota bacterium]|nr:hypothetical protein [Acidobacteriota bacterium]
MRPKRKYVEQYAESKAWEKLGIEQQVEVADHLAGLPSELIDEDQEAKQFDLLMLRLQLAILRHELSYERLRKQVIEIAGLLEEKAIWFSNKSSSFRRFRVMSFGRT